MKRFVSLLITSTLLLSYCPLMPLYAEEDNEHSMDAVDEAIATQYSLDEDGTIHEYSCLTYDGYFEELIMTIEPNGTAQYVSKKDGQIVYTTSASGADYNGHLDCYMAQYSIMPLCNLSDNYYTHYFLDSHSHYFPPSELSELTSVTISVAASIIGRKLQGPLTSGLLLSVASYALDKFFTYNPYAATIIENDYDVYYIGGGYYSP